MREKINLQELTALLSDKAGITKKEADAFLREFFGLMTESLIEDKIVKIRDLGTFKLTDVEARESVDVRTGERFLIAAHSKVSFNPDNTLSELINKPYEHLEPELIEEGVSEMLPEFNESNKSNEEDKPLENNIESKEEEKKEEEKSDDNFPEEKKHVIEDYDELAEETIQKKRKKIKTVVFTFLIVGALMGIFYYLTRETGDAIHYTSTTYNNKVAAVNGTKDNPGKLISTDTTITVNPEDTIVPIKNTLVPGKKRLTRVADRLTMISYEEYGDVVFWIYIYDENKNLISKDNYVKAGIEITIPPPEKYDIDANDPKSLQKARDFARTYNEKHPNPPSPSE